MVNLNLEIVINKMPYKEQFLCQKKKKHKLGPIKF